MKNYWLLKKDSDPWSLAFGYAMYHYHVRSRKILASQSEKGYGDVFNNCNCII